jgi:hypothetical protein
MSNPCYGRKRGYSRRAVLAQVGLGGVAATLGQLRGVRHAFAQDDGRPWYFLDDAEARWLAAACDTLIPEDEYPSASQAGVVDFIDFQLASDYGAGAGLYMDGPHRSGTPEQGYQFAFPPSDLFRNAIDALLQDDPPLTELDAEGRHEALRGLSESEDNLTDDIPAQAFFTELRTLTNQGYFADPIHLGNHDYAGWQMVGFPGAHAYYLSTVDDHNRHHPAPPMGVAHDRSGGSSLPRLIERGE